MKTVKLKIPRGRKSELAVSCQVVINPFCGLSVIFCGSISHLIGRETINIPEIFSGVHGFTGKTVNESIWAKFHKARAVPYALQSKVENTLLKMEKDGVIERVTSAVSVAPIVVVGKKESEDVRVCGDFSVTYNAYANVETPYASD